MDDSPAQVRRSGGIVEPMGRAAIAKERVQTPDEPAGPRFELRDAFAEVTYRASTFDEMVAKADHVGAIRFTAIDEDGRRTHVHKVDGAWPQPAAPERSKPPKDRDGPATSAQVVPLVAAPNPKAVVARIDADAERMAQAARLEAALNERYVIKRAIVALGDKPIGQTEYRYRGDTARVAFTESTFRIATDTNNPSVARSMVDLAQARNWQALRVSGHEDFRRLVWLEASVRGVKTIGYEPVPGDLELLRKERTSRQVNLIEPTTSAMGASGKASARGGGSRKTVLAALEAVLIAQRVPEARREAIMVAAAENLAKRLAAGEVHKVKVYDKTAPPQRSVVRLSPDQQRMRERTTERTTPTR